MSHYEMEAKGYETKAPKAELDLDRMDHQVQNLSKFKKFYD